MTTPLLLLTDITKTFGPKVANDRINLEVHPGRIHALVGENGAGKTTLMSMINGTATPDSGEIRFQGQLVQITSPQKSHALGIGMVFQHFKLVGSLTVAANVFLGRETTGRGQLDTASMEASVATLGGKFGLDVDPSAITSTLSVGEAQRVEVIKALSHDTRLLILDEPTAVLTPSETDDLFVVIRELARQGCAVIFISHKLDEVLEIADEVTVIRDGRTIATVPAAGLTKADIATMMVGRDVLLRIQHTPPNPQEEVLKLENLTVLDPRGLTAINNLDLAVRAGEIVGIAGVEGNGQTELAAAISGMIPAKSGTISLRGRAVTHSSVAARRRAGLAYIPEDRHLVGTAPSLSVAKNIAATHLQPPVARAGWISTKAMRQLGTRLIRAFDIRGALNTTPVGSLSGGNMQKVVLAREFESNPALLVVAQPTRGVDVGAMEFVHNALVRARDQGAAVLLISADLNEVMSLSDRLLVIHRGEIIADFTQDTMSETAVGLAMAGVRPDKEQVARADELHAEIVAEVATETARDDVESQPAPEPRSGDRKPAATPAAAALDGHHEPDRAADQPPPATATTARRRELLSTVFTSSIQPILAILAALLVGTFIILALGVDPLAAYAELFFSSFSSPEGIGALLALSVPLLVLSAAVILSFRTGLFNLGGEGQLYIGALTAAVVGAEFAGKLPGPMLAVCAILAAMVAGGIWGLIPGALLAAWNVDIIVTTLMMSSIATLLTAFLVSGPFGDPEAGTLASKTIDPDAMLPIFLPQFSFGLDLVIALAVVITTGLVLTRSVWGLRVQELGELNRFAEYTGVNSKAMSVQVMLVSGAVSGLAGALFVLGPNGGRFVQAFSPGFGFLAITVALLARLNPWAAILAALFYANMMAGSNSMQINTQVPYPLVSVIQGLIIVFITGTFIVNWRRRRPTTRSAQTQPVNLGSAAIEGAAK